MYGKILIRKLLNIYSNSDNRYLGIDPQYPTLKLTHKIRNMETTIRLNI